MKFLEKLYLLMKDKNIGKSALCKELEINSNSFVNWENRGTLPSADVIIKLANYFDVSSDYLLGLDDVPNRKKQASSLNLTDTENRLLIAFKELSRDNQMVEVGRIERMAEENLKVKNEETA